ncbi:sensor histidine kinase [Sulfuricurvum sp.]|uniref:sensor histidine kinase n=1 Tax=Sulfuricurvum sp. TaxID=2025608 RepID=UPI002D30B8F6|nr:ATP-binding protein [Sulfuricurvum sp.]HZF71209.1 ATP-binding protein [Sulfuricurvum sp.]
MISFFRQKLLYQVYAIIIILMALIMLLIGYLVLQEQERTILSVMQTQAQTLAKSIELVSADAMVTDDQSFLVEHNLNVLAHSPTIRFIIISKNGRDALLTRQGEWRLIQKLPASIQKLESDNEQEQILNDPYAKKTEKIYYYTYPLNFDGISWGWIHLGFSLESLNDAYNAIYSEIIMIFFIVFIILSTAIYFLSRYIVQPIIALSHASKKMAQGDMKITLDTTRKDEIGELTRNFSAMAESLSQSQRELKNSNFILEQKVEERTRELEEINHTLDERVRTEIAHRREQEQILIQQSRFAAMGEMIGNIAHQWRQPLNALSLLLQNIENAYDSGRLDQAFIQRVIEKGTLLTTNMSTTIDDFRNFFKPNRNKELFDVSTQLNTVLLMMSASFEDNRIQTELDLESDLKVNGFANEFSQVLLNILNNAKEALIETQKDHRLIRIRGYKKAALLCLEISDNAGGISEKVIDKIFDPYFTTKEEGKGTGIGLYMSKVIVETNMHGQLSVRNDSDGAVFMICLPNSYVQETK